MEKLLKIGITHGDINGIGYEVILKTLADQRILDVCTPVIYGSSKAVGYYKKVLELEHLTVSVVKSGGDAMPHRINVVNCCSDDLKIEMGQATPDGGLNAFFALDMAMLDVQNGVIDAMVTAPINKSTMPQDRFPFAGHTEYLEAKANQKGLMLLLHDALRVALVTNHVALKDVAANLTEERILTKLHILHKSLRTDFGISTPRIAVLALNPHAGDNGLFGHEEAEIIAPAIRKANERGILCFGPFAADGFWGTSHVQKFDAVLAMYHDQGLAPFKAMYMDEGVNFTAGLPFVRTSPDHGTAYDLVGKNKADESSLRQALYVAVDIVKHRAVEAEITANPLVVDEKMFVEKKKNRENA
ncbi:MAG: 4-hydroxythreonine-4-phosphate dehydrogenase PdxA [Paludibacteraceae bacterium]